MEYVIYKVRSGNFKGQFRWYLRAANGRKIATGGESFHNQADCLSAIGLIKASGPAPVVTVEE